MARGSKISAARAAGTKATAPGARGDAKREAILRGAKTVFLKDGFAGSSMDDVAAQAGVSKMTVYRHFGSKEELFAGLITDLCARIVDVDLEEMLQTEPREALRAYARKMIAIVFAPETVELHRIVVAEGYRFAKLGQMFYATGPERLIDVLANYFARNRRDPRFKLRDPRRSAEEFLELLRGYAHLRMLLGLEKSLSRRDVEARIAAAVGHVLV
jgi:TetR/AcrR family transcriptional repressor of mexJK operon